MGLSKPTCLKTIIKTTTNHRYPPPPKTLIRHLSFATPEDEAAERRRRKRRLRIEPPLNSLRTSNTQTRPINLNPNTPKLPEHVSFLTGTRLTLHNRILKLITENDLTEALLLTRHSVYSNCKPTIFTVNAVMNACLRHAKYADLLNLHRFITQAAISANIVTYNLVITTYLECRKVDTALEHYKQLVKEDILGKGWEADATVYNYLMSGEAKNGNWEGVFGLYEELKEKLGGVVNDGVVYGSLIKGYFLRGMDDEAMRCFEEVFGDGSKVKMSAVAWNSVLDALFKNGKFDVGLNVFDKMLGLHDPPKVLMVNLGSYNAVVDGYCGEKRFVDAIKVFNSMEEKRCYPDTLSFNNLIEQLCENGLLGKAEEVYNSMSEKSVNPDEFTFVVLMDTCLEEDRPDDAASYFKTMVEAKLRPNLGVYNRLMDGLVKVGKVDEAKVFFDMIVPKLRMDDDCYKFITKALFDIKKHDEVLEIIGKMLREEPLDFSDELQEFVREELRKEEREEELVKLMADVEREKAEAVAKAAEEAERAKASTRAAVSSLLPSRLFGDKVDEENEEGNKVGEENVEENEADGEVKAEDDDASLVNR
nr:hypothetical protein [Tanacetum cinerariifolium]